MAATNTLIVYASRRGDEEKCAREIFDLIDGKVDICDLNNRASFPDASTYDAVIIGSSVYHGKIPEPVSNFCRTNLEVLVQKRLGLFITCPDSGEKAEKELQEAYPPDLFNSAIARDYFGGEIDPYRLSILEKIKCISAVIPKEFSGKIVINKFANAYTNHRYSLYLHSEHM